MNVYARVNGKLAMWAVDEADPGIAQMEVQMELTNLQLRGQRIAGPVLAVISRPEPFYFASEFGACKPPIQQ